MIVTQTGLDSQTPAKIGYNKNTGKVSIDNIDLDMSALLFLSTFDRIVTDEDEQEVVLSNGNLVYY